MRTGNVVASLGAEVAAMRSAGAMYRGCYRPRLGQMQREFGLCQIGRKSEA